MSAIASFIDGRLSYKLNFYCHPGRAGGTPMLLAQLYHLALSDGDLWRAPACKCESEQWGMIANRL